MLISSLSNLVSQEWFQVGSTWYFNDEGLLDYPAHGYVIHSVEKDTMIDNLNSKLLKIGNYLPGYTPVMNFRYSLQLHRKPN